MKQLIILVGMPGSGKTTAASYFRRSGVSVFRMGELTEKILKEEKRPLNENEEKELREKIRRIYGEDIYAKDVWKRITGMKRKTDIVVIDGMRTYSEYKYFIQKYRKTKINNVKRNIANHV